MILCDTDVIIELLKGNSQVFEELEKIGNENVVISAITAMEIFYGAFNDKELKELENSLAEINTIDLNEDISQIAINLIVEYSNSHNLEIPDALIAASAISESYKLFTYNIKDFKYINRLNLYKPDNQ